MNTALINGAQLGSQRANGTTPLHAAVRVENAAILRAILDYNPPLDIRDAYGNTPLHYAVIQCAGSEMAMMLAAAGANPYIANRAGKTPIDYALEGRREDVANALQKLELPRPNGPSRSPDQKFR